MKKLFGREIAGMMVLAACALPGVSKAAFVLDTGTPTTSSFPILESSQWFAAEFTATAGETLSEFAAYLAPNNSSTGSDTFSFDIYANNIINARSINPLYTATGTFSGTTGWSSTSANYTIPTTGDYWIAVEETSSGSRFDVPEEASTSTGTAPAQGFAFYSTSNGSQFKTASAVPIGLEISVAVPEPATYGAIAGAGLLAFSVWTTKRRKLSLVS